jgi:hypothetical protein
MFTLVCLLLAVILLPMALRAMAELSLWVLAAVAITVVFLLVKGMFL